ncbi:hypothetical protein BJX64DRAFT_174346 [Aspergillus heterothallicus]
MPPTAPTGLGLAELLEQQVSKFGTIPAIEQDGHTITFHKLHRLALSVAQKLQKQGIQAEEPVAILARRGINHIICQVGVVYSGASCVPLDVGLPDGRVTELLRHLDARVILTDAGNAGRCPLLSHILVDFASEPDANGTNGHFKEANGFARVTKNETTACSHIFHTSGSTGKPKAVRVLARGLINLVFNDFDPIARGSRLAHVCNIGFDVSMWEIWACLLHGATIVVFNQEEILDVPVFKRKLRGERIDVMWQTTSLLAMVTRIDPTVYASVDTLLTGGETINVTTIREIFTHGPPRRLFNAYGPTELSVLATYYQISASDAQGSIIPIGRPLSGYRAFVVDEDMRAVPDGEVGELVVGGVGVAGGYIGNPEKTSIVFIDAQHLCPGKLYRTGDMVRVSSAGVLEYNGRRDNEVKISGQRVELESVERCLLETRLVSAAAALKVSEQDAGIVSTLAAYVVLCKETTDPAAVKSAYKQCASHLMVPRIRFVKTLPLTGSGKIDRSQLARKWETDLTHTTPRQNRHGKNSQSLESQLGRLWGEVLGLDPATIMPEDDFFSLGGTSLQVARLLSRINQTIQHSSARVATIFECSSFSKMCGALRHEDSASALGAHPWMQDMSLGQGAKCGTWKIPYWRDEAEGRIFLTGATGFVGSYLLAELLALPQVKTVICLVRAKDPSEARSRIQSAFTKFGLTPKTTDLAKVVAQPGELAQPSLGLGPVQYAHAARQSSVVFHLAAHVNFVQPYSSHRDANILGMLNIIRFSQAGRRKAVHYTSSISAYGPTGLITGFQYLSEDIRPRSHVTAIEYETGYGQSKFAAECIAWNAIDSGLPVTIHRLGFVLGHANNEQGAGPMNSDDFISRLVCASLQTGVYPSVPGLREDFVPVDFAVSSMLHIASDPNRSSPAYNIVHPRENGIQLADLFRLVARHTNRPLREVPYGEWIRTLCEAPDNPLSSLLPMLEEAVWEGRSRWEMQEGMPEFGTDNLREVLSGTAIMENCPSLSSLVEQCAILWVNQGEALVNGRDRN